MKKFNPVELKFSDFLAVYRKDKRFNEALESICNCDYERVAELKEVIENPSSDFNFEGWDSSQYCDFMEYVIRASCLNEWNDWIEDVSYYVENELFCYKKKFHIHKCGSDYYVIYKYDERIIEYMDDEYVKPYLDTNQDYDTDEETEEEKTPEPPIGKFYLVCISKYFPLKPSCRQCGEKVIFSGSMSFNTDKGHVELKQFQCQGCGKLKYGEAHHAEGILVALQEPCECGGQYRRDKNIFCPHCSCRKGDTNRTEDFNSIDEEYLAKLQKSHGTVLGVE